MSLTRLWKVVLLAFVSVLEASLAAAAATLRIGVTQIVEHPALDAARQGFIDRMAELGFVPGVNVIYDIQSAQGDQGTALTIAQKFAADRVDLVLAIATSTAKSSAQVILVIPIFITVVTDCF